MREQSIRGNDLSQLSGLIEQKDTLEVQNNQKSADKKAVFADDTIQKLDEIKTELEDSGKKPKNGKKIKVNITGNKDRNLSEFQKKEDERIQDLSKRLADKIIDITLGKEISQSEATDILRNNTIDEVVVSGGEKKIKGENGEIKKILTFKQDLDSKLSNYILNLSKGGKLEDIYSEGAKATILDTRNGQLEPGVKTKGLRIFLDAGGTWMNFDTKGKTSTLRFDHHGHGQRKATSGSKIIYEFLKKGKLIEANKDLEKFINFVTDIDNLSYINNTDEKGRKIFNEEYFKNVWPNTLYAISEKMSFNILKDLIVSGKIDPSKPLTEEELNGEIGSIKSGNLTIKELCAKAREGNPGNPFNIDGSIKTIEGINNAKRYAKQEKLNLENTFLGNIIYCNFGKVRTAKGTEFKVKIMNDQAFIGTKAMGYDTYVNWNNDPDDKKFFINSTLGNLGEIAARLNKIDPGCATEVRETFLFGKIDKLTEAEFLNALDPRIIKNSNIKMPKEKLQINKKGNKEAPAQNPNNTSTAEGVATANEQSKSPENNELMDRLLKMIEETNKREERIAELKKYILEKEKEEEITTKKSEIENASGKTETNTGQVENNSEKTMNEVRKDYADDDKNIQDLLIKKAEIEKNRNEIPKYKIFKRKSLSSELKENDELIKYYTLDKVKRSERFNRKDREMHPFAYFVADKIKNPSVRKSFTRNGVGEKGLINKEYISLDLINSIQNNNKIVDPMSFLGESSLTMETLGYNDTVKYNIYGFCIKSENREEITDENNKIKNIDNPKARFQVIGADGNILMEKATYKEANQRYQEETEKYKKQVEEEFKNLQTKK